jgi:hypothetical protein
MLQISNMAAEANFETVPDIYGKRFCTAGSYANK